MAHRVSLRYLVVKLAASAEEVVSQLRGSATTSFPEALVKGVETFRRQLTAVGVITGTAMAPTLNGSSLTQPDAVEQFLMRLLPRPAARRTVFDGDVVALTSPLPGSPGSSHQIMVRRVAALEGDEMVSDEPEVDGSFRIPDGHCWVLADNESLVPPAVIDSRTFGPLPLSNIIGRVMYAARSETDHGPVENSDAGMASDAPVLEAELDLDRLVGTSDQEES